MKPHNYCCLKLKLSPVQTLRGATRTKHLRLYGATEVQQCSNPVVIHNKVVILLGSIFVPTARCSNHPIMCLRSACGDFEDQI